MSTGQAGAAGEPASAGGSTGAAGARPARTMAAPAGAQRRTRTRGSMTVRGRMPGRPRANGCVGGSPAGFRPDGSPLCR